MVQINKVEIKEIVDLLKEKDGFFGSILTKFEHGKPVHSKIEISVIHGGKDDKKRDSGQIR